MADYSEQKQLLFFTMHNLPYYCSCRSGGDVMNNTEDTVTKYDKSFTGIKHLKGGVLKR